LRAFENLPLPFEAVGRLAANVQAETGFVEAGPRNFAAPDRSRAPCRKPGGRAMFFKDSRSARAMTGAARIKA
jgi:hypothetical protein